jgi:BirA family transcriptional regulator, biotin operon repressor / biotin---[acetyl-CoA-carboxylase] ligase
MNAAPEPPSWRAPLTHWEGEPVASWQEAWGVPLLEVWASIGSTSDRALELAERGGRPLTVVIADEQTRGRGRRGAAWHSPPGAGLWMSVVMTAHAGHRWLPLMVGLAVAEAIEGATGVVGVGIKWPNDLLLGARKVGGILCESAAGVVVAGVGVNVRAPEGGFPETLAGTATALDMEGAKSLSASRLAGLILDGFEDGAEGRLGQEANVLACSVLEELAARDVLAGRRVHSEEQGPGIARGISPEGALLLERPDGSRVAVSSGSVRALQP